MPVSTPRVVAIAQARTGSSRLPGKVLQKIAGQSLIAHLVHRLRRARTVADVVVATTTEPVDDAVEAECRSLGVHVFRGDEHDVLDRYFRAAEAHAADVIVRVTGDCPLLDPEEVDRVVREFLVRRGGPDEVDYASNQAGTVRRIPHGLDVEVASRTALDRAAREATDPGDREHVMPYLYRGVGRGRTLVTHPPGPDRSTFRVTVDTPADLELVRAVVEALGRDASYEAIVAFLERNEAVAAINAHVTQKGVASEMDERRARVRGRVLLARADAGSGMGFGHVARMEALLGAWVECDGVAILRAAGLTGALRERARASGIEIVDASVGGDDLDQTLTLAEGRRAAVLAVDGYGFGREYLTAIRARHPLLVVDDLADGAGGANAAGVAADIVLDPNVGARAESHASAGAATVLAGAPYVLLRSELRLAVAALAAHAVAPDPDRVVLSLGGADPRGLTAGYARALLEALPDDVRLSVVLGPGAAEPLASGARGDGRVEWLRGVRQMGAVLSRAAVAVLAAGTTTWEALALGVPCVLVSVADNQRVVIDGVAGADAAVIAGSANEVSATDVATLAAALLRDGERRRALRERGRRLIDGRGVFRVVDALTEVIDARTTRNAS